MSAEAPARILVVDDEPDLRTLYELTLLREGYRVDAAGSVAEALSALSAHRFELLITDMRLPDGLGLSLLQRLAEQQRSERAIVMTAYGSAENAVESLKAGAFDYLTKPVDLKQFRAVVASALQGAPSAMRAASPGRAPSPTRPPSPDGAGQALSRLVGDSAGMRAVKDRVSKVAGTMAPVLVRGESGTGKELVARALHACSHRQAGPFVAVNCSAIPESLLEAEFFGARKGAYTGSTQDREGYFQAARGGTLFLDEIGDLPLSMQAKLLRAVQERRVRAIGSTQEEAVDVRIVSATHRDLAADVQIGRFRQDLYYRLNVIEIQLPALRQRREDLPALCRALLDRIAAESGLPAPALGPEILSQLQCHPLSGNVRELENLLYRAIALSSGGPLELDIEVSDTDLSAGLDRLPVQAAPSAEPDDAPGGQSQDGVLIPSDLQSFLDGQERDILVRVLQETGFNRTAAAQRLGMSLRQIRYRIERLNISVPGDTDLGEA